MHPSGTGYTVRYHATTGATFVLNTTSGCQAEAQEACNNGGGHLAAFTSWKEQNETERYLIDNVSSSSKAMCNTSAVLHCHEAVQVSVLASLSTPGGSWRVTEAWCKLV